LKRDYQHWQKINLGIIQIIQNENVALSDQKICDLLTRDKIVICRRTITKYRKKLNLPSARHRKLFNIKFRKSMRQAEIIKFWQCPRINSANLITTLSVLTICM
jgi:hypothetical protein